MNRYTKWAAMCIVFLSLSGCDCSRKEVRKVALTETVKLDFHIRSRCPFSVKVLEAIFPVLDRMGDHVTLNLHYIGIEKDGRLTSMHGESEVNGNLLQICAREVSDTAGWIRFLRCQMADWRKIPDGWEACAETAKMDRKKLQECYEGEQGKKLLQVSYRLSAQQNVKASPALFLNGQPYTGGRTEEAFARAICGEFKERKPDYCAEVPEPLQITVTVVADKRCQTRACNTRRFLTFVRNTFEGAEVETYDFGEPEGKAAFQRSGQKHLPIAVFGEDVVKAEAGFARIRRRLVRMGTGEYVYPLGDHGQPPWNPMSEICDDGIDNTGNGLVDCDDETCREDKACRPEQKHRLDLFVMSQCPYGVRTVDAVSPVLEHFGHNRASIDFHLQFLGEIQGESLTSRHGQKEVEENIRQLCAQKLYPDAYRFMTYVNCRNAAFGSQTGTEEENAWESCATDGISAAQIRRCAEGTDGKALFEASIRLSDELGFSNSPSWLINNRYELLARSAQHILSGFCERNRELPACKADKGLDPKRNQVVVPEGSCNAREPRVQTDPAD